VPLSKKNSVSKKVSKKISKKDDSYEESVMVNRQTHRRRNQKCASTVSGVMPQRDLGTRIAAKRRLYDS